MTEYKKLSSLIDILRNDIATVSHFYETYLNNVSCDVDEIESEMSKDEYPLTVTELHKIALSIKCSVTDVAHRVRKIVLKARESDPNKQIFNETMCNKIEQLLTDFATVISNLFCDGDLNEQEDSNVNTETSIEKQVNNNDDANSIGDNNTAFTTKKIDFIRGRIMEEERFECEKSTILNSITEVYEQKLVREAKMNAEHERVAHNLKELQKHEEYRREVMCAEESQEQKQIMSTKRNDYEATIAKMHANELMRWNNEELRRTREHTSLVEKAQSLLSENDIRQFLTTNLGYENSILKSFAEHMRDLTNALLKHPEDVQIRTLRNNNHNMINEFGHPSLTHICGENGISTECMCARVMHAAEIIWYVIGYEVRYSRRGSASVLFLIKEGVLHDTILPCGASIHEHQCTEIGFEPYSERLFELQEPDATTEPDKWLSWYERVQALTAMFSDLARR